MSVICIWAFLRVNRPRLISGFSRDKGLRNSAVNFAQEIVFPQRVFPPLESWSVPAALAVSDFGRRHGRKERGDIDCSGGRCFIMKAENLVLLLLELNRKPLGVWYWGPRPG